MGHFAKRILIESSARSFYHSMWNVVRSFKTALPTCEGKIMLYHIISSRKDGLHVFSFCRYHARHNDFRCALDFWSISQKRSNLGVDKKYITVWLRQFLYCSMKIQQNLIGLFIDTYTRTGKCISHYYGESMRLGEGIINHVFNGKNVKWNKLSFLW